jgi:plastin-1
MYLNLQNRTKGGSRNSSSFLNAATITLLHTSSRSEKKAYAAHINSCFENDFIMKRHPPIDPSTNDLFETAKDGVLLCKLIDLAVSGTIDECTINTKKNDGEAYAVLLNTLAPECCNLCPLESKDLMERAKLIWLQAEKLIVKDI